MAADSKIEWTDATWNPIVGCTIATPGCTSCYAMKMAARIERMNPGGHYDGTTKATNAGAVWTGKLALAPESILLAPLRRRKPTTYFVNSMGDLLHEDAPDEWIDRVFAVMALCPQHTFQVLTKRSARMRAYLTKTRSVGQSDIVNRLAWDTTIEVMNRWHPAWGKEDISGPHRSRAIQAFTKWPLPNVWLGVSAEDQRRADERIPDLLATPAAIRFVSAEPLLGPIDFNRIPEEGGWGSALDPSEIAGMVGQCVGFRPALDWIIVGGESGPGARPMHPAWARSIRDQCEAAGVAFFFKQWGAWLPGQNERTPWDKDRPGPGAAHWQDGKWGSRTPPKPEAENYVMWEPDGTPHAGGTRTVSNYFDVAAWAARVGKKASGRLLDGRDHNGMPEARV